MATTPVTKGRAATASARAAVATAAPDVQTKPVTRREFLYYIWGASMALLLAESSGAIIWFALPRFRAGEFGGVFSLDPAFLPVKGSAPVLNAAGKFWMSNQDAGFYALSQVCTHLGCLFKWVPTNNRFECPCHGSHFNADGTKRVGEGPAQRNLDRFIVAVTVPGGLNTTDADGGPVKMDGAKTIAVDTGKKILGKPAGTPQ